ncbi:ABC transporter permease [Catenisphaera adipataccumulans]|uniref:Spermidine/putrescine transport system permease protein n=1 Tax=Catenisphaera adipataccumulans TaxID=700500 RepID=A0A7W8CXZ2_9FIRM|nr:ABC transporter permease [Catenisphaera adipataccumulans]MBB5182508.1 spermidine/putrescine transport system permease protein [Catenisphaera adipataccumulans]
MKKMQQLALPYLIWSILMLLLPMLLIVFYSVITSGNTIIPFRLTLEHYVRFFTDPDFLLILWRSLSIALETTIICLLLGYPIAYYIARCDEKRQNLLILLITLPMWINMLVRTNAWIGILSNDGVLVQFLSLIGFHDVQILYTRTAVLIGMVYNFLPFMILQIHTSLSKMDNSLIEAAADLGANRAQTFWRVTFPLSMPGVVSGIALVFLPSVSSFFIPKLLGGGQFFLIGNVIENQFITVGEWNFGSAISVIIALIMMLLMMLVRKAEKKSAVQEDRS